MEGIIMGILVSVAFTWGVIVGNKKNIPIWIVSSVTAIIAVITCAVAHIFF